MTPKTPAESNALFDIATETKLEVSEKLDSFNNLLELEGTDHSNKKTTLTKISTISQVK